MNKLHDTNDVDQSIRRVRRGCFGIALIFAAMAVFLTTATGNLFFLTLLLITIAVVVFARQVR